MKTPIPFLICSIAIAFAAGGTFAADEASGLALADLTRLGHSQQGDAFDEGPRGKPWEMKGIGKTHFPITHSDPQVQVWFDHGNTLLHNYWEFKAERAFRWCLKLEPDNAMAYWGLARSVTGGAGKRRWEFLQEAVRRKASVSDRERMYIETWAGPMLIGPACRRNRLWIGWSRGSRRSSSPTRSIWRPRRSC